MPVYTYDWTRFWLPHDGTLPLADDGYLSDPEGGLFSAINTGHLKTLEQWEQKRCLVLLGEPGAGKSRVIQQYVKPFRQGIRSNGHYVQHVDLVTGDSESQITEIIASDTTFNAWLNGSGTLDLFIDSLDEGLLRVGSVASLLTKMLPKYHLDRLFLRICCRTADWPLMMQDKLVEWYGQSECSVLELAPLRRKDVIAAANTRGIDGLGFLDEVARVDAVPLAIKPITLDFLFTSYKNNTAKGSLPHSQWKLYELGCSRMCTEIKDTRRTSRLTGSVQPSDRMAIAGRIAALSLLSNRYAVYTGVTVEAGPATALTIDDIRGQVKRSGSPQLLNVDRPGVEETLGTMFSSRGSELLGFAHHSYAEFLAAWHLHQCDMPFEQLESLFWHPDGELVPQLHGTAAWLSSIRTDMFEKVLATNPDVLLGSDLEARTESDRAEVVHRLLTPSANRTFRDRAGAIHQSRLRKLRHRGLAAQLEPIVADHGIDMAIRSTAIDIAVACQVTDVQDSLLTLALDDSDDINVRVYAAYALSKIADRDTRSKLRPLLNDQVQGDIDHELEGCVLMALWPDHLTAAELFPMLHHSRSNLYGTYASFLHNYAGPRLKPEDLPVALAWVESQPTNRVEMQHSDQLIGAILTLAWDNLDDVRVLMPFAKICLSLLKSYVAIISKRIEPNNQLVIYSDDVRRRRLVEAIIDEITDAERETYHLIHSATPILIPEDILWLTERLDLVVGQPSYEVYLQALGRLYRPGPWEINDRVVHACRLHPRLAEELKVWLDPVPIRSPESDEIRKLYARHNAASQPKAIPLVDPPPATRIASSLEAIEAGNWDWWRRLWLDLTLEPNSQQYKYAADITAEPGWQAASTATQNRILAAAELYITQQDPRNDEWFGTNAYPDRVLAGYAALRLLALKDPAVFANVTAETWTKWAPILLAHPMSGSNAEHEQNRRLLVAAYSKVPAELTDRLVELIRAEDAANDSIFALRQAECLWSPALSSRLLDLIDEAQLSNRNYGEILGAVLTQDVATIGDQRKRALETARKAIEGYPEPDRRPISVEVGRIAALECADDLWSDVWSAIQSDEDFGRNVLEGIANHDSHASRLAPNLSENQLADLYIWLVEHCQDTEHADHAADPLISRDPPLVFWRHMLIRALEERGTLAASTALCSIGHSHPELGWIQDVILRVEHVIRRRSWVPPLPNDVVKLLDDHQRRWVQSGEHLLSVVVDSLGRLQQSLQGVTRRAPLLWNRQKDGTWWPRDEEEVSDYIKSHLEGDLKGRGLVANREVQILKGSGGTTGQDTDIYVQAASKDIHGDPGDIITVIVEHKCCWNAELMTAMKTQLVDRYLNEKECVYGLYVVTWFESPKMDPSDNRKPPTLSRAEVAEALAVQADQVTKNGLVVRSVVLDASL